MAHLKRYNIPAYWKMPKKGIVYASRPSPGPHPSNACIPLSVILRHVLNLAETSGEAKKIVKSGKILVDRKPRKNENFPAGLMDIIEIPEINKSYRVWIGKAGLEMREVKALEADTKLCKITCKSTVKKGLTQLGLHDGRAILLRDGKQYKPGDSLLIKLPDQKIVGHGKFAKGETALIIGGKNMGLSGKIRDIKERKTLLESSNVFVETADGAIETHKDYTFIISTKPVKGD